MVCQFSGWEKFAWSMRCIGGYVNSFAERSFGRAADCGCRGARAGIAGRDRRCRPGCGSGQPAAQAKRPVPAQQAQKMKDAKAAAEAQRETSAAGQRAYAAGVKAFDAGDIQGAEQQLSVALGGGGLPNAQMARALYYRGASYRQLGRPAQAISDLTTAVWLKGGLPDDLKAKAIERDKLAYPEEAGLGNTPPPVGAPPLDQSASSRPLRRSRAPERRSCRLLKRASGAAFQCPLCRALAVASRHRQPKLPRRRRRAKLRSIPRHSGVSCRRSVLGLRSRPRVRRPPPQASRPQPLRRPRPHPLPRWGLRLGPRARRRLLRRRGTRRRPPPLQLSPSLRRPSWPAMRHSTMPTYRSRAHLPQPLQHRRLLQAAVRFQAPGRP